MAKQTASSILYVESPRVKRPGVHSKTKSSNSKKSKFYTKAYKGQGRS